MVEQPKQSLILIVDDNPSALYVKRRVLSREGYRIIEATTGTEALSLAVSHHPDLVILDVNLPDISGVDVCAQLKTRSETKHMKVLQTSAVRIAASDRVRGLDVGVDSYLIEPAEEEELLGTVRAQLKLGQHELENRRLIDQLRESEARFRTMAEAVPSFLFETDAAGWNTWTSEGWCRFTGQTLEQVAGHGWAEALHPEDRAANIGRWLRCMQEGVPFEAQQRLRRTDGNYAWVIARALPVRDDLGRVSRWVGSVTDVDGIVRGQDALRESQERLVGLVNSAMDAVIAIDADQRIVLFNPAAERMFGCLTENVVGSSIDRFIPETLHAAHRVHVEQFGKSGTTARSMGALGTIRGLRANGEEFPIEASISQMMAGGTHLFTVILRDITDRKQAERALQQRNRQLELLALVSQRLLLGRESEQELLESIFHDIAQLIDMEMFYHYRPSEDPKMLRLHTAGGISEHERRQFATMGFGELLCGRVAERRQRIIVEDLQHSSYPGSEVLRAAGATSYVGFPLVADDELVGTIAFISNRRKHLCEGDVQLIQTICDQIATALERTKLQGKVRESEERLRLALEGANLGSWDVDLSTDAAVWNRRHALMQGYEPETGPVSMELWRKLVHPDDLDHVMRAIERAMRERDYFAVEHRMYRADNQEMRWLSLYGRFTYDDAGEPVRFSGVSLDVTQRKRAEEQLKERHRFISEMTAVLPGVLYIFDLEERRNVYVNRHTGTVLGYSPEEITAMGADFIPTVLHPDDAPRLQRHFESLRTLKGQVLTQLEYRFRHRDGSYRWFLSRDAAWQRNPDGSVRQILGMATDITERKQAEEQLQQSEERWQLAVTGSTDGIWDWDIAGHTVFLSSRWKEMRGYREDELGGDETEWSCRIHPDDYARVMATVQAYLKKDLPVFHCEYRTRCKDGRYLWIVDRGIAIWDERGQAVRMVGSETDVTLRKHAEERLRENEERLRVLTTAMPQLVWACSSTGECIYQSPQWETVTGQSVMDSLEFGWAKMIHPEDRMRTAEEWRTTAAQGMTYQTEYRLHMKEGTYRWYLARAEALRDESGTITQWIGTSTDIDEAKRTEAALRQSEERLRLAHQAAGVGAFDWNVQTGVNTWTAELEAIYGLKPGEFGKTQRDWQALLHPEDRAMVLQGFEEAFETGMTTIREFRILRPDGTVRWVAGRWQVFNDEGGRPQRLTGVNLDITARKETEAQVREGQERLRLATQTAAVGIWEWNVKTNQIRWDAQMFKIYQTAPTADGLVSYDTWRQAVVPDDLPEQERVLQETVCTRGSSSRQFRIYRYGDGEMRHIEAVETVRTDDHGETEWVVGTNIDVTERKQAQEALRESELRFRTLVERIGDVFWISDPSQGQLVYVSQAFADIWGRDVQQLCDRFETWIEAIHKDDRERVKQDFFMNAYEGRYDCEYRIVRPDGRIRWIHDHGKALGIGKLVAGVAEDITERKLAEEALRESEERYRATFTNAAVGIGRVNFDDGRWIDVNDALCAIVGYSREELQVTPWPQITHPEDVDLDLLPFRRMAAGEVDCYTVEKRFIHKQGHPVWARLTLSLVRTAEGTPAYEIAIVENVTDRKQAEQALHEAQQRLQRWNVELEQAVNVKTAELRHSQDRLRSMAAELNLAEQRERKRLATELHDHLQQMLVLGKLEIGRGKRFAVGIPGCEAALKRVDTILSDALTYSRTLVAELSPPVLHEFGLGAGLRWLADYMKKHGLTVTVSILDETDLRLPESHMVLLFQSVRELLINASKHAGTGKATVQLIQSDDQVQIEVRDDGRGFDLAAAAAAAANTPNGGISSKFGLLSIQERMSAIDGSFDIQSVPGQGTTARLVLPLSDLRGKGLGVRSGGIETVGSDSDSEHPSPLTPHSSRIRVLLVDDHLMVRQGLRAVLEAYADIELVGEAANGEEALRLADQQRPSVVVMDINMPKMNGIEATEKIKKRSPETVVIGLSVNAEGANQEAMKRAGAVLLMTKEAAVEELYVAIVGAVKQNKTFASR